jgi:hypothetical protein
MPVVAMTGWEYEERALECARQARSTTSARAGSAPGSGFTHRTRSSATSALRIKGDDGG